MRVERKHYRGEGLRLLFKDTNDFKRMAEAISEEKQLIVGSAGKNYWYQDRHEYPFFIAIPYLRDRDYKYLDKLIQSFD